MSSPTNWSACIFCNKKSYKQDKKLLKIESDERVSRITNAASHNGDLNLLHKISQDNFKEQAFYHNQCITKYLTYLKKDIEVVGNSTSECESINAAAFSKLISSINDDLLRNKKAFLLFSLIEKFVSYLPENMPTSFTTRKLQRYLENHYGDSVVIQSQQGQGKSNMIMSSNITLGDAIKAASNLKTELKWSNEKQTRRMYSEQTDDQLLYSVASIIWRDIEKVRIFKEHYPNSTEVSFESSLQSMPVSLVKLLSWITDEKAFSTCTVPSNIKTESVRKCLALTECIVATSRSIITPFHLGLAIQVYHEFGSKRLIEILNAHGFCVTYSELRRYLTSVANHEISRISGDRYIPGGILPISEGGRLI